MAETAAHLVDRGLPQAPYRQWVLSVPKPLRLRLARASRSSSSGLGPTVAPTSCSNPSPFCAGSSVSSRRRADTWFAMRACSGPPASIAQSAAHSCPPIPITRPTRAARIPHRLAARVPADCRGPTSCAACSPTTSSAARAAGAVASSRSSPILDRARGLRHPRPCRRTRDLRARSRPTPERARVGRFRVTADRLPIGMASSVLASPKRRRAYVRGRSRTSPPPDLFPCAPPAKPRMFVLAAQSEDGLTVGSPELDEDVRRCARSLRPYR